MTARKRKSPKGKKPAPIKGVMVRGLKAGARGIGHLMVRHPAAFGGSAAFAVVFSFVAANAMWYQPGAHPSPLLRTRMPAGTTQTAVTGGEKTLTQVPANKVTTFVIEREDQLSGDAAAGNAPKPSNVILEIQKQLAMRGFFEGDADGLNGPKTSSAVARFQRQSGRVETGLADAEMLALLLQSPETAMLTQPAGAAADNDDQEAETASAKIVTPQERPLEEADKNASAEDPVAAAIRKAETEGQAAPRGEIPVQSEMVMEIQKGLANIAYADIAVDGIAGEQTKAAIRHFEKHYRLPQTGQPNEKVLKKLEEIGAL